METAFTALLWGLTVIIYCIAGISLLLVIGFVAVGVFIICVGISDWWKGKAWEKRIREAKKKVKKHQFDEGNPNG